MKADKRRKWSLDRARELAKARGGELLSSKYINTVVKLIWKCKNGHVWSQDINHIYRRNSWCPKCSKNKRLTLNDANTIAKKNGGLCLSKNIKGKVKKLNWQCKNGHKWKASLYKVKRGTWCIYCAKNAKVNYKDVVNYLKFLNFELLTDKNEYKTINTKLEIKCNNNHVFKKSYSRIKHRGEGCSLCNTKSFAEEVCRKYFEKIFDKKFPRLRPKWLINPATGYLMELDGYCSELGIAFEHHGSQHYSYEAYLYYMKAFKENKQDIKNDFEEMIQRDCDKIKLCKSNCVKLLIIPSLFNTTKITKLNNLFIKMCEEQNISFNLNNLPEL